MAETTFYGREKELAEFRQLLRKKRASLVTCQGRRRVGKSTFIARGGREADHFLSFVGLPPRPGLSQSEQLRAFGDQLARQTAAPSLSFSNWSQAWQLLATLLPKEGKTVLLLDEISWMGAGAPDFAGELKTAWDTFFSRMPGLVLVLCGSVSSWIEENILNNTGFVGRCSWQFNLQPLPLPDCVQFWGGRRHKVSSAEILRVLAVTGGIPRYLEECDPRQTAEQNIERLCFTPGGPLLNEFDQIFHDIFSRRAAIYRDVVHTLVEGRRTLSQVSEELARDRGGSLGAILDDLEKAGFIRREVSFDPASGENLPRTIQYRLSDNYLRFHLKYVEPVREQIAKGLFQFTPLETLTAWGTIMGLQFENLILGELEAVRARLDLGNVAVLNAGPYFQPATQRRPGCQIDLLLRAPRSLYVCEIKFRAKIPATVMDQVRDKVQRLARPPTLPVRTALIYEGELDPAVAQADYFDYLIPAARLLE